jgi:hypothetical protein
MPQHFASASMPWMAFCSELMDLVEVNAIYRWRSDDLATDPNSVLSMRVALPDSSLQNEENLALNKRQKSLKRSESWYE